MYNNDVFVTILHRWDLQRARTLIQHQYLLDRYKRIHEKTLKPASQKPSKPNIDSFLPKPQESKDLHTQIKCCFYAGIFS